MKRVEAEATDALFLSIVPSELIPAKVPATISANAAAIRIEKSQTKMRKRSFPDFPT
jgi:hypothetical protein